MNDTSPHSPTLPRRARRRGLAILTGILLVTAAACQNPVEMWATCSPAGNGNPSGTDGVYILICEGGRWVPKLTVEEYVDAIQGKQSTVAPLPKPPTASQVTTGLRHACARLSNGTVKCWGRNGSGQLGIGRFSSTPTPTIVKDVNTAKKVVAGAAHTCALLSGGPVACWGFGGNGQLGRGTLVDSNVPVLVSGITNAVDVSVGDAHSCAVLSTGRVKCWGKQYFGNMAGAGGSSANLLPATVPGITTATHIVSGDEHTCVRLSSGSMTCFGLGDNGERGDGVESTLPLGQSSGPALSLVSDIAIGDDHTCARLATRAMKCWGDNGEGQLGNGEGGANQSESTPVDVSGSLQATQMSAAANHTCARILNGTIRCWGRNANGQLGNGTTTLADTPTTVSGITNATQVSASRYYACARLSSGMVKCWGTGTDGQLGPGNGVSSTVPVRVGGI